MDTCDGYFSGAPRERALEIMKDSRAGAMGVVGAVLILLLKVAALGALTRADAAAPLLAGWAAARALPALDVYAWPYARAAGTGEAFTRERTPGPLALAGALLAAALVVAHRRRLAARRGRRAGTRRRWSRSARSAAPSSPRPPWRSGSAASPATSTAWASSWPRRSPWSSAALSSRRLGAMKLYLVRHGASTGNTPGNLIGHSDHPLTAAGEAQARAVAARLAPLGPMPIHCSDLPRARATAEFVGAEWSPRAARRESRPAPARDPARRLRGPLLGRLRRRHRAGRGPRARPVQHRAAQRRVAVAARRRASWPPSRSSCESCGAGEPDALAAVCVVAHDGPIRAVVNHVLGVPPEKWWTVSRPPTAASRLLEWSDGWVNVRFVNDTSHLAGLADVEPGIL